MATQQQQQQQDPQTIKNPKTGELPKQKSPDMNDRDYLNDILANQKYLTDNFNVFAREASHSDLYDDIKQILAETHDNTRKLFNIMFEQGYYKLKAAKEEDIQQAQQQFSNYFDSQSPY
jgi:ferritin-like metal-binding protein YciE